MNIKINEQPIDFTLEHERNLGEVLQGIGEWLGDSEFRVSSLEYDGTTVVPGSDESEKWKQEPIDKIDNLDITILSDSEQYGHDLFTIHQYLSLLQRALAAGNRELIEDLKTELPFIVNNIDPVMGSKNEYGRVLEKLVEESGIFEGEPKATVQQLRSYLQNLLLLLQSRLSEVTQPLTELRISAESLRAMIPQLMDVSVNLQTGKDKAAMDSVIQFTEISEKLIRLYRILQKQGIADLSNTQIEEQDFSSFYAELNDVFHELEDAFNSRDSVLIGDLLEYEVAPRTERLMEFILNFEQSPKTSGESEGK